MWTIASVTSGPMLAATRAVHGPIPGFPARSALPGQHCPVSTARSALADPAQRRLGPRRDRFGRRLVLAVTPGAAGAVLMMALPA
jgi:hypothetical protein